MTMSQWEAAKESKKVSGLSLSSSFLSYNICNSEYNLSFLIYKLRRMMPSLSSLLVSQYDTIKGECNLKSTTNEMKEKHN